MLEQDKKMRTKYRTTNWSENHASLKVRGSLTVWLDKEMQWLAEPNGKRGRNQTFSDAAIQIKCLFGQPLRPSTSLLHLLVDSTGIKFLGEGEWKRKKHGAEYRRKWRKVHLGIDAQTLEIRPIEVTGNSVGDAPMFPLRTRAWVRTSRNRF